MRTASCLSQRSAGRLEGQTPEEEGRRGGGGEDEEGEEGGELKSEGRAHLVVAKVKEVDLRVQVPIQISEHLRLLQAAGVVQLEIVCKEVSGNWTSASK